MCGVHWLYTYLQKQNKNMRKHMLLPETVSDQTVLGHQPISCPACHNLVFWAMHRTLGEHLACFAALQQQQMSQSYMGFSTAPMDQQPSEQSLLPSILQMLQRVTWQSTLTTSLEIKANKTHVQSKRPNFDLCFVHSSKCLWETGHLLERVLFIETTLHPCCLFMPNRVIALVHRQSRWEWPIPSKDPRLTLALVFQGAVGAYGHLSG